MFASMNGCFSVAFCVIALFAVSKAEFTSHFSAFLNSRYGAELAKNLTRADLGLISLGSFGGKEDGNQITKNRPVIFVHGVTQRAGVFVAHRTLFCNAGYDHHDLYATSWGDGGLTPMYSVVLKCEYAKQIRQFIIAVNEYTGSPVDVIAYSMGVAVSRKAILGGRCVDSNEDLGEALTMRVGSFVSLAGVVHGIEFCPELFVGCNRLNGFSCDSEYLKELNTQTERYEGQSTYSLYSREDGIVGQRCCGSICSELPNARNTELRGQNHGTLFFQTELMQKSLNNTVN